MMSKKGAYVFLAMFLWALIFDILYDLSGIYYWNAVAAGNSGGLLESGKAFFETPAIEKLLIALGAAAGYRAGNAGWQYIYVEDRRKKKYKLDW